MNYFKTTQSCNTAVTGEPIACRCTFETPIFFCPNIDSPFQLSRQTTCSTICKKTFKNFQNEKLDDISKGLLEEIKDSVYLWNRWREVKFNADGVFWAPTGDCESGKCFWRVANNQIFIQWGNEGLHTVIKKGNNLQGIRFDGEKISASFVRKEETEAVEDLYVVLGVDVDATDNEIKKRYRKLSREIHPDKFDGPPEEKRKVEERFMKVQRAYEILKEDDSRMIYDTGGIEAVEEMEKNKNGQQPRGNDLFSMFFGGMGGQQMQQGQDVTLELKVSLADVYNGRTIEHKFNRRVVCRRCSTINDQNRERCSKCRTKCPGEVKMVQRRMGNMIVQQQEEVPSKERCKMEDALLEVIVEKGMKPGEAIKFPRKGEQTPGILPGDVLVKLVDEGDIRRHLTKGYDRFKRSGNDLKMKKKISLKEALTGFRFDVLHLDKDNERAVHVENDGQIIYPGMIKKIPNEGMPVHNFPSQKGNLLIEFEIAFPKKLSPEQEKAITELF
eukprot:augustus_masked-scaffold_20-processed-gene-0.9-mRNA-1 protein AED:0.07 eAED:0.07 QI:0/-1/0/1/-1/1/1/0/499